MADRLIRDENDAGVIRRDVDMGDGTFAERYAVSNLQASPEFYIGREFRTFHEFSTENGNAIPTGQRIVIRATLAVNTLLTVASASLDDGEVRIRSIVGGTPAGVFSAMPTIRANAMTSVPSYTAVNTFEVTAAGASPGVGVTGGVTADVIRAKTSNASGQTSSVGSIAESARGLPAGVVLILVESIGSSSAEGVLRFRWTEVPA